MQSFSYPFPGTEFFYTGAITVPLQISLYYSTHKVFKSHVKSSQADFLYSSVLLVPIRSLPKVRVRVTLRLAVYHQSVRLGAKPLENHGQIFFQLNTYDHSPYVTTSLTRGWVCRLQLLLALASALILRSESRKNSCPHFTVSNSRHPQPGGTGPPPRMYFPPERSGPVISPGTGFSFRRLSRLAGLWWR
jgi:hypothetical protein